MQKAVDLTDVASHFEFGANWRDYLRHVDDEAIVQAEQGLLKLLPRESLRGARFLDIGCGSGLHTLAALRLGAAEVTAVDIDANSVAATREILADHAPGAPAKVFECSVFDATPETLGTFDIVYSWGVLHHTGAMWPAIERAGRLVRPGGLFAIALYRKAGSCAAWTVEKRLYTAAPEPVRKLLRGLYHLAYYAGSIVKGRNPFAHIRNYKGRRGMNFYNDVHDWMGGYPYESSTPEETVARVKAAGFEPVLVDAAPYKLRFLGTGCAEYVFRKTRG